MKKILSLLVLSIFFCGGLVFAADSTSNRKDMTLRLGMKTGTHIMYATSTPFVLEFPGEDWTFGLTYGSGKYSYSYRTITQQRVFNERPKILISVLQK